MSPHYSVPSVRSALTIGSDSDYSSVSVLEVNRVNFDHSIHVNNLHYKRCIKVPTTLLIAIDVLRDGGYATISLHIKKYFDNDGSINSKAPKFFLSNGMSINLICPPVWRTSKYA